MSWIPPPVGCIKVNVDVVVSDLASGIGIGVLKDIGDLHYFLGIEAHRNHIGLYLCQRRYIVDLLHHAGLDGAKPLSTPMAASTKLSRLHGSPLFHPSQYRSIVGGLQYLNLTHPDISFVVNKAC
ncbi:PREDICTED: uncharacterized protein LOC109115588 [Nelumbo nucifera]|uniref:Uncharacterized protein LOC109115588 n=1 Tax=Nelumbo nucifera TaxID=4432 RepID=A0A1U8QBA7_NELNU|nr:PREDICTED: uncharacterized protein LOC109115588 [Nelumbo nucifera]